MTSNLHSFEISLVTGLETTFRTPFVGIVALKIHARNQFYIYIQVSREEYARLRENVP